MAQSLESAFADLVQALASGNVDRFFGFMHADAIIVDEDLPFRVDRAGFQAHISFHGPDIWENFAWKPHNPRFQVAQSTGVVVGFANFRGKPRDSGFRLRPMMFSQSWHRGAQDWQLVGWHQSPIIGHVSEQSPA